MNITGRLALVTGASSGIGAATARAFARRGARVLLLARSQKAWWASPEYAEGKALRQRTATSKMIVVEGYHG